MNQGMASPVRTCRARSAAPLLAVFKTVINGQPLTGGGIGGSAITLPLLGMGCRPGAGCRAGAGCGVGIRRWPGGPG